MCCAIEPGRLAYEQYSAGLLRLVLSHRIIFILLAEPGSLLLHSARPWLLTVDGGEVKASWRPKNHTSKGEKPPQFQRLTKSFHLHRAAPANGLHQDGGLDGEFRSSITGSLGDHNP